MNNLDGKQLSRHGFEPNRLPLALTEPYESSGPAYLFRAKLGEFPKRILLQQ